MGGATMEAAPLIAATLAEVTLETAPLAASAFGTAPLGAAPMVESLPAALGESFAAAFVHRGDRGTSEQCGGQQRPSTAATQRSSDAMHGSSAATASQQGSGAADAHRNITAAAITQDITTGRYQHTRDSESRLRGRKGWAYGSAGYESADYDSAGYE